MKNVNLFESKIMLKLQEIGAKVQVNKVFNSINGGMMSTMSLILAGAVFMIIATLLNMLGIVETTNVIYQWLVLPYNMTMGLMGVAISFMIGYIYSQRKELSVPIANGIVTMILFVFVAAPVQTVVLEGGSTMNVLDTSFLGSMGLFTAIIVPLISVQIIGFCENKGLTINMPDVIPQFLKDSFTSLIPLTICIVFWSMINIVCQTVFSASLPALIIGLISVPLGALISVPGMFVLVFLCMLLWSFGIHGSSIVIVAIIVPMMQYFATNAELAAAGQPLVFSAVALYGAVACCGGTGNVLPLAVLCTRAKSDQLKAVGKIGLVPALFNISEPMIFGIPIMYNPIMAIPFILNPLVIIVMLYIGYSIDFFKPGYIMIMTTLPVGIQEFMSTMAWQNVLIPVFAFIIGYIIYLPFVKVYDKQLLGQEKNAE